MTGLTPKKMLVMGARTEDAMAKLGITIAELAGEMKWHEEAVMSFLNGIYKPSLDELVRIAEITNRKTDWLLSMEMD